MALARIKREIRRLIRPANADPMNDVFAALPAEWQGWFADKELTADWTSHNFQIWAGIVDHLRDAETAVLEIGSYEGRSAVFWLEYLPRAHLTCIDCFGDTGDIAEAERRFDANMRPYGDRVDKIRSMSLPALSDLVDAAAMFDIIYVDGSHTRDNVMVDSLLSWRLLKPGGILIWDDYRWHLERPSSARPRDAIDTFLVWHADDLDEVHRGYQVIVRKRPAEDEPS